MALRDKLGLSNVCVTWLLCPRNLRPHAALALWWSSLFYHFFLLGSMWQYGPWLTQSCTKIRDQDEIWMCDSNAYYCRLLLCNLPKTTVIFSSIMASAVFIGLRFPHGEHMPAVDLLHTARWRWAVSSFSAPTFLGFFWSWFNSAGVLVPRGSLQHKACVCCLPLFLDTSPLCREAGQGADYLTLLWMPLSDPQLKTMLHCYEVWEEHRGSACIVTWSWRKWSLKMTAFAAWNSLFPRQVRWTNTQ